MPRCVTPTRPAPRPSCSCHRKASGRLPTLQLVVLGGTARGGAPPPARPGGGPPRGARGGGPPPAAPPDTQACRGGPSAPGQTVTPPSGEPLSISVDSQVLE